MPGPAGASTGTRRPACMIWPAARRMRMATHNLWRRRSTWQDLRTIPYTGSACTWPRQTHDARCRCRYAGVGGAGRAGRLRPFGQPDHATFRREPRCGHPAVSHPARGGDGLDGRRLCAAVAWAWRGIGDRRSRAWQCAGAAADGAGVGHACAALERRQPGGARRAGRVPGNAPGGADPIADQMSVRVNRAGDLAETIANAARVARQGCPGPVHVSLPADVLMAEAEMVRSSSSDPVPEINVAALRDWLDAARRPVIVLGPALNATRQPGLNARLEAATGAPVVAMESPRGLNDPSLGALGGVFAEADRVLLLGKPLDFALQFGAAAPRAGWAVIHADPDELSRAQNNCAERLTLTIEADPVGVARALAASSLPTRDAEWRLRVQAACARRTMGSKSEKHISSSDLCAAVQKALEAVEAPVLVCDGGEFGQWAQAGVTAPRRIINGVSGAIGGGLCYAMGARAADPKATVFALMGDGTAGFHLSEFETAVREDLPFVAIIGNDQRWNAEHQIQLRDFGSDRLHGCGLSAARYDEAMIALGGFGALVTDLAELPGALRAASASGRPACLDVRIDGQPAPVVT